MGSASDPSPPPMGKSANKEVLFDDDPFREDHLKIDRGLMKNATLRLETAIPDEEGKYKVVTDYKFLQNRKATPPASAITHNKDDKKKHNKLDMLYAQIFEELDLELKAKRAHVPAEGEPVFKSGLEEHVREQTK